MWHVSYFGKFAKLAWFPETFGRPSLTWSERRFSGSSFAMGVGEGRAPAGLKRTPGIIQETVLKAIEAESQLISGTLPVVFEI